MKAFQDMLRRISSSIHYNRMIRFVHPLKDHLGINHFWYYHINYQGYYTYFGTHLDWSEYCFHHHLLDSFPCLRHPNSLPTGISLMKNMYSTGYDTVLRTAWEKFQINFNLNLTTRTKTGIEAFGFGTRFLSSSSDDLLLNELPLLRQFLKLLKGEHQKLFDLAFDNQVDLSAQIGARFKEKQNFSLSDKKRDFLLKKMGLLPFELTPREREVLSYVTSGYPASYIAEKICLSRRTVENYIANIKSKLLCSSKIELIQKAQELASFAYLQIPTDSF